MVAVLTRDISRLAQMRPVALTHVMANQELTRSLRWSRGGTLRLSRP
jgi:hypothetical protein